MTRASSKDNSNDLFSIGVALSVGLGVACFRFTRSDKNWIKDKSPVFLLLAAGALIGGSTILVFTERSLAYSIGALQLISAAVGITVGLLTTGRKSRNRNVIRASDVTRRSNDSSIYGGGSSEEAYIGQSILNGSSFFLEQKSRKGHVVGIGPTGAGKTTLIKSIVIDAIKNDYPAVIIDPKADLSTPYELQKYAEKVGKGKKIRIFSFKGSTRYNPLKHGTPMAIKDRIMDSFSWSEQYYREAVSQYLAKILPGIDILGIEPSLPLLDDLLNNRKKGDELLKMLMEAVGDPKKNRPFQKFKAAIDSKATNLDGLVSQVSSIANLELGHLFNPQSDEDEIDLRDVAENREIAYFSIPTLGYPDTSRRLGKLIISDIMGMCTEIYQKDIPNPGFMPLIVDEFGDFVTAEFASLMKECRGAGISINLFFQGLGDLNEASPEIADQILQNFKTLILFRQSVTDEVERLVGACGTVETKERSRQIQFNPFGATRTGMGNERTTRQMRVEHDALKSLPDYRAVVFKKDANAIDCVALWNSNNA